MRYVLAAALLLALTGTGEARSHHHRSSYIHGRYHHHAYKHRPYVHRRYVHRPYTHHHRRVHFGQKVPSMW